MDSSTPNQRQLNLFHPSFVYARYIQFTRQAARRIASSEVAAALPEGWVEEFPVADEQEFAGFWARITESPALARFWARQLELDNSKELIECRRAA